MHRPRILFLDEPTSGLDPVSRHCVCQYLRDVRSEDGTTVFLTTHYVEEAEEADRVCVIDRGRIAVLGTPEELKRKLIERSIWLDAADRSALLRELHDRGCTRRSSPQRRRVLGYRESVRPAAPYRRIVLVGPPTDSRRHHCHEAYCAKSRRYRTGPHSAGYCG
jgi:ABC-type multidrug transport system ATPase subunit